MKKHESLRTVPSVDPFSGGPLIVTEVSSTDGETRIKGRFALPRFARLDDEQIRFLETFLRCRGMLNGVERELGLSYPTVRARLDALLESLDLIPEGAPPRRPERSLEGKRRILDDLEQGLITPEEAKARLAGEPAPRPPSPPSPTPPEIWTADLEADLTEDLTENPEESQ